MNNRFFCSQGRSLVALLVAVSAAAQTEPAKPAPRAAPTLDEDPYAEPAAAPAPAPSPTTAPIPSPAAAPAVAPAAPASPPAPAGPGYAALRGASLEVADLAAALEPYLQTCRYGDALLNRQCEALKERLMYLGVTKLLRFAVPYESGRGAALVEKREVVLRACLTCAAPVVLSGELSGGGFVLGKLPGRVRTTAAGFTLDGIELARAPLAADDDPAKVAPALVAELVFKPRNEPPALVTRQPVLLVELVGWRVHDRCTGKIYASFPAGDPGAVAGVEKTDPTCPGYVPPVVVVEEKLPETLTAEEITRVMEGAREDVLVCYDRYGVAGYAPAALVVGGADGRIRSIAIGGKYEETETAACIEKLMRSVTFPRFKTPELKIDWKFYLNE